MSYFTDQDGLKHYLESRWEHTSRMEVIHPTEPSTQEFPIHKVDLIEKYREIERVLNNNWHPNVTLGAAISGDGLLTDHGVEHIISVMHHACKIIGINIRSISGYEIFILLMAIHFHDLGNIYGRTEHEKEIDKVIDILGDVLPLDTVEKEFVAAIAKAHGGYCDQDRDTIRYVSVDETCNGIRVRAKMIAALLRFSDELSDDFSRSVYNGITIPKQNEVFHLYSKYLEPISISGETIKFHFRIPYKYTQDKVGKGNNLVFLYDEIQERLAKCMRELEYCRKFADGYIPITTLNVTIDIMDQTNLRTSMEKLSFRMRLIGYPDTNVTKFEYFLDSATNYSPSMNPDTIKYKTGEDLKFAMAGGV